MVFDDGSSCPIDPVLRAAVPDLQLTVIRNECVVGPAAARNRAVAATRADYLWFLDSDTEIVSSKTADILVGRLTAAPHVGAVGGVWEPFAADWRPVRLIIWPNFFFVYSIVRSPGEAAGVVGSLGTCNLMMRRRDFDAIGGFDETLYRDEDVDLCLRLRARGFTVEQLDGGLVRHYLSPTGRDSGMLAQFRCPDEYLRAMLETRARLLARHRPLQALLLPALDALMMPMMALQVLRGRYSTNRAKRTATSSVLEWGVALVRQTFRSYLMIWKHFLQEEAEHA
jgi:GT2 family glycosyltransferase